jgi:ketosteroid isomerase-like protein
MIGALMAKRNARTRFAARAENDVETFLAFFADDAVFKFPGESPVGGTFRGREAIRAQFEQFRERTKDVRFELVNVFVNRLFAFGATNEVAVQWRMRLRGHSNEGVAVVQIRRGKIVLLHEFLFNPLPMEALRDSTRELTDRPSP